MGFGTGSHAKVWEVKPGKGNYIDGRISTSSKQQDGKYETDFSGYVHFAGQAKNAAAALQPNSNIKITNCTVKNNYDKRTNKTYYNFWVFGFENEQAAQRRPQPKEASASSNSFDDEPLPFDC